jgi:hypothetical protein
VPVLVFSISHCCKTADYTYKGHKISIRTANLDQPWQGIHQDLLTLVA